MDGGGDGDVSHRRVAGVEDDVAGLEHGDVGAHVVDGGCVFAAGDLEDVEGDPECFGSRGSVDMEAVHIHEVATPGDDGAGWAAGAEDDSGDIVYGAAGQMLAGDPLGIIEAVVAGMGGEFLGDVEDAPGSVGHVHAELDGLLRACSGGGDQSECCGKCDES